MLAFKSAICSPTDVPAKSDPTLVIIVNKIISHDHAGSNFAMVFAACRKAGFYDPEEVRINHVPFGLVLRADGKNLKLAKAKPKD